MEPNKLLNLKETIMGMSNDFQEALKYETSGQKLGFLNNILTHDLESSYIDEQADVLNSIPLSNNSRPSSISFKLDDK